jgi:hypothetical protein
LRIIRDEVGQGMSTRQISRRHHLGSRMSHQALDEPAGSPRHKQEALPRADAARRLRRQTPRAAAAVICPAASRQSAGRVAGLGRDVGAECVMVVLVDQVGSRSRWWAQARQHLGRRVLHPPGPARYPGILRHVTVEQNVLTVRAERTGSKQRQRSREVTSLDQSLAILDCRRNGVGTRSRACHVIKKRP